MTRDELERLVGAMSPEQALAYYRSQYGQLPMETGIANTGAPVYEWQRMNEATGNMEYGPQIGMQGQLPGAPEGMQFFGGFDNNGNLTHVQYQDAPQRNWYDAIGPALPILGAVGANYASTLFGSGGTGGLAGSDMAGTLLGETAADTLATGAASGLPEGLGTGMYGMGPAGSVPAIADPLAYTLTGMPEIVAAGGTSLVPVGSGLAAGSAPTVLDRVVDAVTSPNGVGAITGAALAGVNAANAPDSETTTQQRTLDPRIDQQITGPNGFLPQLNNAINQGPGPGLSNAFNTAQSYLQANGTNDLGTMADTIRRQMGSNIAAPTMQAASAGPAAQAAGVNLPAVQQAQAAQIGATPTVNAAQINFGALPMAGGGAAPTAGTASAAQAQAASLADPRQQGTNLAPGFQNFIYGDQGQNPYLTAALQRGADQARNSYTDLLQAQGDNFRENVLGGIRSNAIRAGGIGDARQGIAEGIAAREQIRQQSQAAQRLGQDLNSAMVGAQSENFQQGRQLGAGLLGTLSGQQYGQEQQRAGLTQGANLANAQLGTQASIANAGNQTQASVAGANNATQAGVANMNAMAGLLGQQANLEQNASLANAGYGMQGLLANQNATNSTGQFNAGQANSYNLAGGQLAQNNNQFNTGQTNAQGQFNANLLQGANTNNLSSQLGTNTLNANIQNQGVGNMWNGYSNMTNLANAGQNYGFNRLTTGMQAFSPYAQLYSGQQTTQPLYNNMAANLLGGAVTGAQLANNLFR